MWALLASNGCCGCGRNGWTVFGEHCSTLNFSKKNCWLKKSKSNAKKKKQKQNRYRKNYFQQHQTSTNYFSIEIEQLFLLCEEWCIELLFWIEKLKLNLFIREKIYRFAKNKPAATLVNRYEHRWTVLRWKNNLLYMHLWKGARRVQTV